ncbi:MAG: DUF3108 domain-containing protein [Tunicatimonas sp.]
MKLRLLLILGSVSILALALKVRDYRYIPNESFTTGEELTYRVHWGLVNAGEAVMRVSDTHFTVNNRPCYKIDVFGSTTGLVDVAIRVRNNWGAYVDTASIVPQKSYQYIEEGRYRKNEMVNFDHKNDKALVLHLDKETRKLKKKEAFDVPNNVLDIVGGYYFLRTIDYDRYKKGDIIKVSSFFDKEVYNLEIRFLGRETISTRVGEINALVMAPSLPDNEFFAKGDPVKVWISNDKNKVPLKVKAEIAVGAIEIDIKEMKNLRN